jgi:hypothetical protein
VSCVALSCASLTEYATRAELYKFVDDELTAITPLLKEPKSNEAYRVDQAAAWMLQAKLYMNAKVYIGSDNCMLLFL